MTKDVIVILDNVRSAHNVGAILRTCDGAKVKKVVFLGITPNHTHPKVKKTALGAEEFLNYENVSNSKDYILNLKRDNFKIFSIEQTDNCLPISRKTFNDTDKIALVFGNEITGISNNILELSDLILEIPMFGKKNSLNVSTCVGIILYNIIFSND